MTAPNDGRRHLAGMAVAIGAAAMVGWLAAAGPRSSPPAATRAPSITTTSLVAPPRQTLGVGSCTSSGCHAAPIEGHAAWQSSYTVWATRDPHARAASVLHEPLAARIVALLAAADPKRPAVAAAEHTACIGCHSPGPGRLAAEGVGCEACHGSAGDWLVAHTLQDWRTAGNTLGMIDLGDPFTCARQCAGCHVGGPPTPEGFSREVSHDLIAAGHPRLAFELRSFKQAEPPHWRDRFATGSSPTGRGGVEASPDPLDEWALGRLGAAHAFLELVARQSADVATHGTPPAHAWPEFTAFDCYACHRPPIAEVDRETGRRDHPRARPLGLPPLQPLQWALLDLLLPADAASLRAAGDASAASRWWSAPDATLIATLIERIEAARTHVAPALEGVPTGTMARRIVGGIDPAIWDEAAAAHAALTAVADRAVRRNAAPASLEAARTRLERLRTLLEFQSPAAGLPLRFDSPRFDGPGRYDPRGVARELDAIATSLEKID